jgi:D-aminopeptidase
MIVVATDAPLDAQALGRVARRAALALGRTGSVLAHGSGDYVIAFSTGPPAPQLRDDALNPVFQATVEATEEAIYNSLFRATTVKGLRGRVAEAIPIDRVRDLLRKHGRVR